MSISAENIFVDPSDSELRRLLEIQRTSFVADPPASLKLRIDRLNRAIALLTDNKDALTKALSEDFGHRSRHESVLTDIYTTIEPLKHAKRNLKKWMKNEKRGVKFPFNLIGAQARVEYQAKGVVGCLSTWNFPIWGAIGPLACIFSAGNRCIIKLSEMTPETSKLLAALISKYFDESELIAVNGGAEVGAKFSALPFDHILFTGATSIGHHILRAAAENLVPVTLELGGKSPVIISRSADLKKTVGSVIGGKMLNAGQICLAPDYLFCPIEKMDELVELCEAEIKSRYPTLVDNPDYSSIINARHHNRLQSYLDDAKEKNANLVSLNPANESFLNQKSGVHKMPLTLILDPDEGLQASMEEMFGPILLIKPYQDISEVVQYIKEKPRPLALYYFGKNKKELRHVLDHTHSGGVAINDVLAHVSCDAIPFGGIGDSGMGYYHGIDGFKTFSHAKGVYTQSRINLQKIMGITAPYNKLTTKVLDALIKYM